MTVTDALAEKNFKGRRRWWQRKDKPPERGDQFLIGQSRATPYLFSLPSIILVAAILGFPVLYGVWQSLYRRERLASPLEYVGFQNYVDMFSSADFWHSMNRTAVFVGGSLVIGTALGLFFSFALFRVVERLRFLRAVTVAPYIISNVAAAVMFRILFNGQFGLVNQVFEWFGLDGPAWLANPTLAMLVVIFTQVWTDLPLTILLLLGGLMTIDKSYLDASLVDGATGWARARHITIPLLAPQILISIVWLSYSTLTGLGVVLALTGGGPLKATQTVAMEMYTVAFRNLEFNQALAIATFILILNALLTLGYVGIGRKYDYEQ
ncbi:MAG TPA: sugar ABC transporter permease [Acidimicrobiia bacterium]|nr:sugar ABC transporter permease [Acidimicrobiia bacterium]